MMILKTNMRYSEKQMQECRAEIIRQIKEGVVLLPFHVEYLGVTNEVTTELTAESIASPININIETVNATDTNTTANTIASQLHEAIMNKEKIEGI